MRPTKKVVISVQNVWKTYEMGTVKVNALRGLSIDIKKGDFVSIVGPSGSGKSTAMNMIGCLDVPSRGKVFLHGQNIAKLTESELAQIRGKNIGFVFQQFNLIQTLSALDNVILPMMFQKVPREESEKRATALLTRVGLGDRLTHKPGELSGGQQQRVSIARALANDPEIILADEPTGNLDSESGKLVVSLLKELHEKEGKTVILVTHDSALAKMSHRSYVLKDGKIVKIKKIRRT